MSDPNVEAALKRLIDRFRDSVCLKYAVEAEQYAKANAPWTDRTGEARKTLKGYVIDEEQAVGFGIAHRKEYGKQLETARDGKYAILKPTIENLRKGFLDTARLIFGGHG